MTIKFGICAGHGSFKDDARKLYTTPGKRTPDGEPEWEFNNIVVVAITKELSKYEGIEIKRFDDPTGKTDVPLEDRTNKALSWGADYYMSIHHNAFNSIWGTHTGVETFIFNTPNEKSIQLAKAVHPALVAGYGLSDRGIKKENLHITREMQRKLISKIPLRYAQTGIGVVLIEGGFMDSTIDIKVLRDKAKLENTGCLIAHAFVKHLKLKLKVVEAKSMLQVSRETMRKEAVKEIKAAVEDKRFTSPHPNVEKYSDEELQNFALLAVMRRK